MPHIFSFLGRRFENFNKTKFVLSLLSSLPPRPATLIVLLALGPHDEPLQFDCIAIRLLNFLHPFEGKCIVFFIVVSTLRRLLPRSVLGNSFNCLCTTWRSIRGESKRLPALLCRSTGIKWQPHLIPLRKLATFPNPQSMVSNQPKRQSAW